MLVGSDDVKDSGIEVGCSKGLSWLIIMISCCRSIPWISFELWIYRSSGSKSILKSNGLEGSVWRRPQACWKDAVGKLLTFTCNVFNYLFKNSSSYLYTQHILFMQHLNLQQPFYNNTKLPANFKGLIFFTIIPPYYTWNFTKTHATFHTDKPVRKLYNLFSPLTFFYTISFVSTSFL